MAKFNFKKTVKDVVKSGEFKSIKKQVIIGAKKGAKTFNKVGGALVKTVEKLPDTVDNLTKTGPMLAIAAVAVVGIIMLNKGK